MKAGLAASGRNMFVLTAGNQGDSQPAILSGFCFALLYLYFPSYNSGLRNLIIACVIGTGFQEFHRSINNGSWGPVPYYGHQNDGSLKVALLANGGVLYATTSMNPD